MASPIEVILIPTLMIVLGYFLKRNNVLKAGDSVTLSKIVLYVTLPSLILLNLSSAIISSDMLVLPFASFFLSVVCLFVSYLFCSFRNYSKKKTWTIMIAASMMNTGFLGFPINLALFGNEGFLNAIFFDMSTTVIFVVFGMILVSIFGGNRREVLKQAVGFVPLWASIVALIFNLCHVHFGYVVENTLNYLGQATVPLIMISLGLKLDFTEIRHSLFDSLFVSVVRLIFAPALMFISLLFIGFSGLSFNVAVIEAGMATAMNALVLSLNYDLDSKLMSSLIFTNTVLALFTLTCWISFLV